MLLDGLFIDVLHKYIIIKTIKFNVFACLKSVKFSFSVCTLFVFILKFHLRYTLGLYSYSYFHSQDGATAGKN